MSLFTILNWLQHTDLATSLKQSSLVFPLVEGSHILSLSLSVGMIMLWDLRLMQVAFRRQPVALMMDQLMQWALPGFCVTFCTGALLFSTEALKAYENDFFRVKMTLLALAGINALYFRYRYQPKMGEWEQTGTPAGARAVGALSLIFWLGVIACGRTMAYEL